MFIASPRRASGPLVGCLAVYQASSADRDGDAGLRRKRSDNHVDGRSVARNHAGRNSHVHLHQSRRLRRGSRKQHLRRNALDRTVTGRHRSRQRTLGRRSPLPCRPGRIGLPFPVTYSAITDPRSAGLAANSGIRSGSRPPPAPARSGSIVNSPGAASRTASVKWRRRPRNPALPPAPNGGFPAALYGTMALIWLYPA